MAENPACKELERRVQALEEESTDLKLNLSLIEKKLHDKDKHMQSILQSADGFAIYRLIVDKEDPYLLRPIFVSPSIRNVLGCEPENFSSQTFFSNIHSDDLARVERANKQAFGTNRFDEICRYYNSIKKQWVWIHAISTGVVNDKGDISHVNGIFIDITGQKKAEESFRRSEEHLRCLMESATNFVVYQLISDETNPHRLKVNFVSPSIQDILGIPEPSKFETWFENMHPDDVERITEANQRAFKTFRFDQEYRTYNRKKGEWRWIHAISTGGTDKKGWNRYVNGILLDITDRKQTEEALRKAHDELEIRVKERTADLVRTNKQLKQEIEDRKFAEYQISASLREKEVLLCEINHRVKNNFEIISSLLDLSSMCKKNKEFENLCKNARARIHSMALVHNQLYQSDRFDRVDMERYIKELVDYLSQVYDGHGRWIATMIEPSEVYLSVNQALPCAIVLNELIANAFKHAFTEKKGGTVQISVKDSSNDTVFLKVKDDGDSVPKGIDFDNTPSLGLKLVRHLVEGQLNGEMRFDHDNGTEICIAFKRLT